MHARGAPYRGVPTAPGSFFPKKKKRNVVVVVFGQATGAIHVSIVDLIFPDSVLSFLSISTQAILRTDSH